MFLSTHAQMRFDYLQREWVRLYGKAAAGISFVSNESYSSMYNGDNYSSSFPMFSAQLSPIGIEVGKQFGGYLDAGIGTKGLFELGLYYKF